MRYKDYRGEIPLNTVKTWGSSLTANVPWQFVGWSGLPKEPFRHWAAYPELTDPLIQQIWDTLNYTFKEEGINLIPERAILNLYNHGDSSWLHKDCESDKAWTVIIYLNDQWDINWGGDTVIVEDNEILKSFAPTPGKFIIFKSNMLHGGRPVSREAPFPKLSLVYQCDSNLQRLPEIEVSHFSSKV